MIGKHYELCDEMNWRRDVEVYVEVLLFSLRVVIVLYPFFYEPLLKIDDL